MYKVSKAEERGIGNRREHIPAGIYITIDDISSDIKFLISDQIGKDVGFELFKHEASASSRISIFRLIGYKYDRQLIKCDELLSCSFRPATDEEISHIEHRACLC